MATLFMIVYKAGLFIYLPPSCMLIVVGLNVLRKMDRCCLSPCAPRRLEAPRRHYHSAAFKIMPLIMFTGAC
jgi:hypothetical protein